MNTKSIISTTTLLATLALTATQASAQHVDQPKGSEKCYGVSASGKNDCAAGSHSCAGQGTKAMDKAAFVYLPAGACSKLAGGSTMAAK